GQPAPGTVAPALVGNLIKEAGLIPEAALAPQPAPAPRPVVEAPKPARVLIAAPAAPGRGKQIVVSLSRQWWYAYQDGNVVFNGPVTTGQPELRTPRGRFTVLSRQSPFTFVSPWPRGHRFWYAPSPCTYALRITGNGVYLHDAPWRPFYGPGTNVPHYDPDGVWRTGSHGCINLPYGAAAWLWSFAPVGTPVQVV
ncbi:MAG: L,D-transpeptidase, partial [Chloroflexota bacterium]